MSSEYEVVYDYSVGMAVSAPDIISSNLLVTLHAVRTLTNLTLAS